MKVRLASLTGPCVAVLLSFVLAFGLAAQDKAPKKGSKNNIQGKVTSIRKDTSTITVETVSDPGGSVTQRQVMYSPSTNFVSGHSDDNKPGMVDKVATGNYISCSGNMAKGMLVATECVYRDQK